MAARRSLNTAPVSPASSPLSVASLPTALRVGGAAIVSGAASGASSGEASGVNKMVGDDARDGRVMRADEAPAVEADEADEAGGCIDEAGGGS
jgi:hypothetical protein